MGTEYKLIRNKDAEKLEEEINKKLRNGWVLAGGIAVHDKQLVQAIVKNKN